MIKEKVLKTLSCNTCGLSVTIMREEHDRTRFDLKFCPQCQKSTMHTERELRRISKEVKDFPGFVVKLCVKCKHKFPTFKGDNRNICENCRFPITYGT